jgi:ribose transport system substrate-binding protein
MDVSQPTRLMAMFVGTMLVLTAGGTEATLGAEPADAPSAACGGSQPTAVAAAFELLTTAQRHSTSWDGPTTGPKALPDKLVVYVAQDMRNGLLGVIPLP